MSLAAPATSLAVPAVYAVLGAVAGATLPRVAYRLSVPFGAPPRPGCAACGRPFPSGTRGWLHTGRVCRCAGTPGPSPGYAALALALAAAVPAARLTGPERPVYALATVLGVLLATIDLRCLRLPDVLVAALAGSTVPVLTILAVSEGDTGRLGRAGAASALCGGAYLLAALLPGGGIGFGDVKLATVLGFLLGWLGWPAVLLGAVAPHLINGPVVLWLLVTRRARRDTALPLGPALLAGALLALAVQP